MGKIIVPVDGAAVFPDMKKIDEGKYILPSMNPDYKYAMEIDGILWASKDCKQFFVALAAKYDGMQYGQTDFVKFLKKVEEEVKNGEFESTKEAWEVNECNLDL